MSALGIRRALKRDTAEGVLAALEAEGVTIRPTRGGVIVRNADINYTFMRGVGSDPGDARAALVDIFCELLGIAWARACRPFVVRMVDVWGASLLALLAQKAQDALKGAGDVPR